MVAAIFGLAVVSQQGGPLFRQHFGSYTGQNGWEEIVLAIEAAQNPSVSQMASAIPPPVGSGVIGATDPIFRLVEDGLKKPRTYPKFDPATGDPVPFGSGTKLIAKLGLLRVQSQLAAGRSEGAIETIALIYQLADATLEGGTTLNLLVAGATYAIAHAAVNQHLGRLPLAGLEKLEASALNGIKRRRLHDVLAGDMASARGLVPETLRQMAADLQQGDQERLEAWSEAGLAPVLQAVRNKQTSAVAQSALSILEDESERIEELLSAPESEWYGRARAYAADTGQGTPADLLAWYCGPRASYLGIMGAELKVRTQLRLLRLHLAIRRYDWERGGNPDSLADLGLARDEIVDPITNRLFEYRRTALGYDLFSIGYNEMGRIDLRYQREASLDPPGESQ